MEGGESDIATNEAIWRITWLGAIINLVLVCFKFAAGILGSSAAIIADAVHSLSDLVTDAAILIGMQFWSRPADEDHPYGHAKIETLVTLFIGAALAVVGVGLLYEAVHSVIDILQGTKIQSTDMFWLPLTAALVSKRQPIIFT